MVREKKKNHRLISLLLLSPTIMIWISGTSTRSRCIVATIGADALVSARIVHPCRKGHPSFWSLSWTTRNTAPRPENLSKLPKSIGIVGGGLAGLSTAYHLLQKAPATNIIILDKKLPGLGGASSVAGGLLHPLSPKGKLVYLGLEGLTATNHLLDAASVFQKNCVLQNEIYRVAVNEDHVATLTHTAQQLPELTEWLLPDNLPWKAPPGVLGGLRLHSGCKVVHMPSYLEGLWDWVRSTGTGSKDWVVLEDSSTTAWRSQLSEFDKVVLCAGSGLFHDSIVEEKLPIQLVRGQSIEMTLNTATCQHAMLCGKYVSPLLEKNRVLIGATHEFKEAPLDPDQVGSELRERSFDFASDLWEDGVVDRITSGFRVQSNRGKFGRIPIVGKLDVDFHDDAWIYTGLSSRGLLHHGIFGEILASKILNVESQHDHPSLDWWHGK